MVKYALFWTYFLSFYSHICSRMASKYTAHDSPTAHTANRCAYEAYSAAPSITIHRDGWMSPLTDRRLLSSPGNMCVCVLLGFS